MEDGLVKRLQSATRAAWWTVLIGAAWMLIAWGVWMVILQSRPDWLLTLWGGGILDWKRVHLLMLLFMGVFKIILFLGVMAAIWLTLWTRQLKRAANG